jgi:Fe2+ transport system protein FeoA
MIRNCIILNKVTGGLFHQSLLSQIYCITENPPSVFASLFSFSQPNLSIVPDAEALPVRLSRVDRCGSYQIVGLHSEEAEITLLRLGLGVGDAVSLKVKLPHNGPLVLEANGVEFALGLQYAQGIDVKSL